MSESKTKEISDFVYEQDILFLNCPKCKGTAYLSFNKKNPDLININCHKCQNKTETYLTDYMDNLSKLSEIKELKCDNHNSFLDKYCYKCHKQFCSECDIDSHKTCSPIKTIKKIITKERLEEVKNMIKIFKENFKNYINTYINDYLIKQSNDIHEFIIDELIKPYIKNMKSFFHFCECAISNYNIDYPDFYQQMNLKDILSIFKTNLDLYSFNNNIEYLFDYRENNYINKSKVKLSLYNIPYIQNTINNNKYSFNDEINISYNYEGIKINKNENCILTLNPHPGKLEFRKINNEVFAIVRIKKSYNFIEIFSTKYNEVIYSKSFPRYLNIFNLDSNDNNYFIVASSDLIEKFKLEDKNIQKVFETKILNRFNDIFYIPKTNYIAILYRKDIELFNINDLKFFKTIHLNEYDDFEHFYLVGDDMILLTGSKIGYFDIINLNVKIIHDDNIKFFSGYLTGTQTTIEYSNLILTYFNRLVCKKYFRRIEGSTYDDIPNRETDNATLVCLFDFDLENKNLKFYESNRDINPIEIVMNENNEILISCINGIRAYNID